MTPATLRRELLMCLLGYGGDIFSKLEMASGTNGVEAAGRESFSRRRFEMNATKGIDTCEAGCLQALLPLASQHCALQEFVDTQRGARASLYLAALCEGVDGEFAGYRDLLVSLEQELLRDPLLPLAFLREKLLPYEHVFSAMAGTVGEVVGRRLMGGPLCEALYAGAANGAPAVRACFERLLHQCHQVFYNQLITWAVYARVPVGGGEFFISHAGPEPALNIAMLPIRYFSLRTAEAVLYIGKAVKLLTEEGGKGMGETGVREGEKKEGERREGEAPVALTRLTEEDQDSMLAQLVALKQQPTFHALTVECTIDRLRETVSSKVWRLLVVDSHLLDHLDAIKRTFLFTRPEDDGEEKPVYAVHSPLHLVLTPSAMERYAELHTFMSRLRNVSFQLQNSWAIMIRLKKADTWRLLRPLWLLRTRMAFVVANVQAYLDLDVVESAYERLKQAVLSSQDFALVHRAHEAYLQFLVSKSFLRHAVVSRVIQDILKTCHLFAELVAENADNLTVCLGEMLKTIETEFRRHTNFLFETQRGVRSSSLDGGLMMRIDYNGYFVQQASMRETA